VSILELKAGAEGVLQQPLLPNEHALGAFLAACCYDSYDNQALYALSLEKEPRAETE